jgi:teichoic acid transport system ATP-binding protein
MSKKQIKEEFENIVRFAGIGEFIDSPMFTYSQGMKLRLGFAIAVHSDPDILILDEGLSVGDFDFQKKATKQIQKFFKANKTIIVVSHWLEFLKMNTTRILWIEDRKIKADGGVEVIKKYEKSS